MPIGIMFNNPPQGLLLAFFFFLFGFFFGAGANSDFWADLTRKIEAISGGLLMIISAGVPTYAGMKTSFHADVSPRNWFFMSA